MYRYEKRQKNDRQVKVKRVKVKSSYSDNSRDKKNAVSVFKTKM